MIVSAPPTLERNRQLRRSPTEKALDIRGRERPQWVNILIEDPEAAAREIRFSKARRLQQMYEIPGLHKGVGRKPREAIAPLRRRGMSAPPKSTEAG